MMITMDRFKFVPMDVLTTPPRGLIEHFKDCWWIVHPDKGAAFFDSRGLHPQCNSNESIIRHRLEAFPGCEARLIPSAFRSIDPHDYCNC